VIRFGVEKNAIAERISFVLSRPRRGKKKDWRPSFAASLLHTKQNTQKKLSVKKTFLFSVPARHATSVKVRFLFFLSVQKNTFVFFG
jgi:hypothetical protein